MKSDFARNLRCKVGRRRMIPVGRCGVRFLLESLFDMYQLIDVVCGGAVCGGMVTGVAHSDVVCDFMGWCWVCGVGCVCVGVE